VRGVWLVLLGTADCCCLDWFRIILVAGSGSFSIGENRGYDVCESCENKVVYVVQGQVRRGLVTLGRVLKERYASVALVFGGKSVIHSRCIPQAGTGREAPLVGNTETSD
jgi:hypothetical protein